MLRGMMQVTCTRASDGARITATLNYNPPDGAITSAQVVNGATSAVPMMITNPSGVVQKVSAPPGTTNFSAAQIAAVGFTNVSQVHGFTVECI